MDLRQLRYFVALYEEAHVGRAAERLCLSQPALSQQMRHLQEDLQVELFQRQGRGLSPTLAAHSLYGHARELLRAAERTREALQVFRGQASQTLALGVLQTVNASLVPALLERLQQGQPHWLVQIHELSAAEIERRLLAGSLDIGISYLPPRQAALHGQLLYEDELQLVVAPGHALQAFRKVSLAQAAEQPMLLLGEEFRVRQVWQEQLAREGRRPRLRAELNHIAGILDSLAHTGLASVLPARAQRLHANQQLLWKPISEPPIALQVGLLYRDSQRQQASLALLRALLED